MLTTSPLLCLLLFTMTPSTDHQLCTKEAMATGSRELEEPPAGQCERTAENEPEHSSARLTRERGLRLEKARHRGAHRIRKMIERLKLRLQERRHDEQNHEEENPAGEGTDDTVKSEGQHLLQEIKRAMPPV